MRLTMTIHREARAMSVAVARAVCGGCCSHRPRSLAQSGEAPVSRADRESPVVPVHEEPHHRQVFQYGTTRILDLQVPPGDISWFHSHEWPVLYMTLGTSAVRTQNLGSDWSGGGARAANAASRQRPFCGTTPTRAADAAGDEHDELHRAAGHAPDREPSATASSQQWSSSTRRPVTIQRRPQTPVSIREPELTNPWFRSYRITLRAGETTDAHEHTTPVVIFQAIDGKAIANGPMHFEFNRPGQWAFYDASVGHNDREPRRRGDRVARDRGQVACRSPSLPYDNNTIEELPMPRSVLPAILLCAGLAAPAARPRARQVGAQSPTRCCRSQTQATG